MSLIAWLSGLVGGSKVVELCPSCRSFKTVGRNCTICGCPVADNIIDLEMYFQGREVQFAAELTQDLKANAVKLLTKVNKLIGLCPANPLHKWVVTSGWRPAAINAEIGGAFNSKHITCQAVDILDNDLWLQRLLGENRTDLLTSCDLYMEDPRYCQTSDAKGIRGGWVHLQSVPPASGKQIFIPYAGEPRVRQVI